MLKLKLGCYMPLGTLLASLDLAIEFADELAESPTWRASCRCK